MTQTTISKLTDLQHFQASVLHEKYMFIYYDLWKKSQMPIPPEGNDPQGIGGQGKGEVLAYSSGFGVGELGNKNTKYRHNFESLVHNQHYTLEILGFHYM